jgi:hypothetical protein
MNRPQQQDPSQQIVLIKVQKLNRILSQERIEGIDEYQIKRSATVASLKDFIDIYAAYAAGKRRVRNRLFIWPTEGAFVCLEDGFLNPYINGLLEDTSNLLRYRFRAHLLLRLESPNGSFIFVHIHATTGKEAGVCLEFLLGLSDSHFSKIHIFANGQRHGYRNQMLPAFPFPHGALQTLLQNEKRKIGFCYFTFSEEALCILRTCEQKSQLAFHHCRFSDKCAIFQSQEWQRGGPVQLTLEFELIEDPFGLIENLLIFLDSIENSRLESLKLSHGRIRDRRVCQYLATATIPKLHLVDVEMDDNGTSIIDSVTLGRGARSLFLSSKHRGDLSPVLNILGRAKLKPFQTLTQWRSFLSALRGNSNLQCLSISNVDLGVDEWLALAEALRENQGLYCLAISEVAIDNRCWDHLVSSIASHRRLRELNFSSIRATREGSSFLSDADRHQRTQSVKEMLSVNITLDTMFFDPLIYDHVCWERSIRPKLMHNRFRKRSVSIQNIESASLRASVLGAGLFSVRKQPSLLWLLLSMNRDIVAERLLTRKQESSSLDTSLARGRKRSWPASFDASNGAD